MIGAPVSKEVTIPWQARHRAATLNWAIGPWGSGVYFVRLTANDGRIGYAPFIVRPETLGAASRIAVVDPDEHLAGVQLPRLRRRRLGRHVVREGRAEHCRARTRCSSAGACRRSGASTTSASCAGCN